MTGQIDLGELDLAALISSRICHDIISPVSAIANGLEVLDEENDEQVREYAMDLIRRSTEQASAKLQFARLAFGAGGSAGTEIGLNTAKDLAQSVLDETKHTLTWQAEPESLSKDRTKLLLNLFAVAVTTLPRGGTINVQVIGSKENPIMRLVCEGNGVRMPERLNEFISGQNGAALDSMSIQPYYTSRIAAAGGMVLQTGTEGDNIVLTGRPGP